MVKYVENQFDKTIGKSGAYKLCELFSQNDERAKSIIHKRQKHYCKFLALGKYLTPLGEISYIICKLIIP